MGRRSTVSEALPPATVDRMARIQRPPIKANIGSKPTRLDEPLSAVVTLFAQALKRAEPELVDVPFVRLDMIADCRRRDDAAIQAILAKRVREKLLLPDPGPASPGIPLVISSVGCERPLLNSSMSIEPRLPLRRGDRRPVPAPGDVGAAQKITLSDLNIDPGQQDLVLAIEQLEQDGNPLTP
jgi:hypothetical protein